MNYVGIDPGYTGAAVRLNSNGEMGTCFSGFSSDDPYGMWHDIYELCCGVDRIAIEKVHAQPKFGAKGAFQFGGAFMVARLAAAHTCCPVEFVPPVRWQREFWGKVADTKKQARIVCRQLWPSRDWKHSGECDAALIAEWLRRRELGAKP